jgi:hypothetical protein
MGEQAGGSLLRPARTVANHSKDSEPLAGTRAEARAHKPKEDALRQG